MGDDAAADALLAREAAALLRAQAISTAPAAPPAPVPPPKQVASDDVFYDRFQSCSPMQAQPKPAPKPAPKLPPAPKQAPVRYTPVDRSANRSSEYFEEKSKLSQLGKQEKDDLLFARAMQMSANFKPTPKVTKTKPTAPLSPKQARVKHRQVPSGPSQMAKEEALLARVSAAGFSLR